MNMQQDLYNNAKDIFSRRDGLFFQSIDLFVSFLVEFGYREILRYYPELDELCVTIKFPTEAGRAKHLRPEMDISDFMTYKGEHVIPFTEQFVDDVATSIKSLKGTIHELPIDVYENAEDDGANDDFNPYNFFVRSGSFQSFSPEEDSDTSGKSKE